MPAKVSPSFPALSGFVFLTASSATIRETRPVKRALPPAAPDSEYAPDAIETEEFTTSKKMYTNARISQRLPHCEKNLHICRKRQISSRLMGLILPFRAACWESRARFEIGR